MFAKDLLREWFSLTERNRFDAGPFTSKIDSADAAE